MPNSKDHIKTEDLGKVIRSLGQNPTEQELREMIAEIDADGNGDVDFPELLTLMTRMIQNLESADDLKEQFKIFDRDGSGFISTPELRHIMMNLGEKLSEEEVNQMIKEANPDENGLINYNEFIDTLLTN